METWNRIEYAELVEGALLGVVRDLLRRTAEEGLPGDHYFYLTFSTGAEGVEMPEYLRTRYPDEMTVILQHQFWELEVEEDWFAVSLSFGGARRRLVIPFAALISFVDPTAKVGLRFGAPGEEGVEPAEAGAPAGPAVAGNEPGPEGGDGDHGTEAGAGADIISFDRFRKKLDA